MLRWSGEEQQIIFIAVDNDGTSVLTAIFCKRPTSSEFIVLPSAITQHAFNCNKFDLYLEFLWLVEFSKSVQKVRRDT